MDFNCHSLLHEILNDLKKKHQSICDMADDAGFGNESVRLRVKAGGLQIAIHDIENRIKDSDPV